MSDARHWLVETVAFVPPGQAVEALDPVLADRRATGASHSIAEIVAHMVHWQEWFASRIEGQGGPAVAHAADGWPVVAPGSWKALRDRYLAGLERVAALNASGDGARPLVPALEFPPLAHYTVGDALQHVGQHNAHHLGQVVLLRQLLGSWPPPSGGWTW